MKYLKLLFFVIFALPAFAQQATEYFPASNGFRWYFKTTMLDSLNQEIDSLATYSMDSLAGEMTYKGYEAKYILGKTGGYYPVQLQPYTDTTFVSLSGTEGRTYFGLGALNSLIGIVDTTALDSTFAGIFNLLASVEGWYSTYRLANTLNSNYTLFTKDTTVTIDSTSLPLRFQVRAKRVNDGVLSTDIGNFNCKKFVLSYSVSYILIPILPITLITIPDTHYVAQGNWLVKQIAPSSSLDLSVVQLGKFTFPGRVKVIHPEFVYASVQEEYAGSPDGYDLGQNYPNPFNPVTTIEYSIPAASLVSLAIYDNLGRVVKTLSEGYRNQGRYRIAFNSDGLASGVYFYRLEAGSFSQTKRMVLLK